MRSDRRAKFWLLAPAVLWLMAFGLFPTLFVLYRSFVDDRFHSAAGEPQLTWVGFESFRAAFGDPRIWESVRVTAVIAVATSTAEIVLGMLLALAVARWLAERGAWLKTALLSPMFMAPVAVGFLATTVFAQRVGLVNVALQSALGLPADALPNWRSEFGWALTAIILSDIWQWTPFCFVIFLGGLVAVPQELREAAALDGARGWQGFWHVTLPVISPVVWTVLLLRLIEGLKVFDIPYGLTRGAPGTRTYSYSMWIKELGMKAQDVSVACALGTAMLVLVVIVTLLLVKSLRRQMA